MACPNIANDEITMLKTARERMGAGYNSNYTITGPIHMSDLQRLSGGNTSGSGNSYPAVSLANPVTNRPDGEDPLQFSEFSEYDQNQQEQHSIITIVLHQVMVLVKQQYLMDLIIIQMEII
jgi:hypothetical protein